MGQQPKTNTDVEDPDEYYAKGYEKYTQTLRI